MIGHAFHYRRDFEFSVRFKYVFLTSSYSFAQTKLNTDWKTYPYIVRI